MEAVRVDIKKAIKRCYPTGRAVDHMKPLPSELSTLMFRLDSHPHKIVRASTVLVEKAHSYPRKGKIGHTSVTLLIMQSLVDRCSRHLSLFAADALTCVSAGLKSADPSLLEATSGIMISFNDNINGVGLNSDQNLANLYLDVISNFVSLCQPTKDVVNSEVRLFAIRVMNSVTRSAILATPVGRDALHLVLPALFANVPVDDGGFIFEQFNQELSDQNRLARTQTRLPGQDGEEESLGFRALRGLRSAFDTPSSEQVGRACSIILRCLRSTHDRPPPEEWYCAFVESLASWCEIQLRFVIVKTVVSDLQSLEVDDLEHQKESSILLRSMFRSDASERGLPVFDVLRQLLDIQHRLIVHSWKKDAQSRVRDLLKSLRSNIGDLAALNVFPGQLPDMIGVVLATYQSPKSAKDRRHPGIIVSDFQDIIEILNKVQGINRLTFDSWDNTYWILGHDSPQVLTFFVLAYVDFSSKSLKEVWPKGLRELMSIVERDDLGSANYVAIYYCLMSLVNALSGSSRAMLSILASAQHTGLERELEGGKTSTSGTGIVSVVQATVLAIAKTTGNSNLYDEALSKISQRVSQRRWLPGIQYPPHDDASSTIANASVETLEFGPVEPQLSLELSKARSESPSVDTIHSITPGELEDELLPSAVSALENVSVTKQRQRSVSGETESSRKMSIRSILSMESRRTPSVVDLVKRQNSDLRQSRKSPEPTSAEKLKNLVGHLHINDSSGRGKLTC